MLKLEIIRNWKTTDTRSTKKWKYTKCKTSPRSKPIHNFQSK